MERMASEGDTCTSAGLKQEGSLVDYPPDTSIRPTGDNQHNESITAVSFNKSISIGEIKVEPADSTDEEENSQDAETDPSSEVHTPMFIHTAEIGSKLEADCHSQMQDGTSVNPVPMLPHQPYATSCENSHLSNVHATLKTEDQLPPTGKGKYHHACHVCGKVFDRPCRLKRHLNTMFSCGGVIIPKVPTKKSHICYKCNKGFDRPCKLQHHLDTTEECGGQLPKKKPNLRHHVCAICSKAYDRPSKLKHHILGSHHHAEDMEVALQALSVSMEKAKQAKISKPKTALDYHALQVSKKEAGIVRSVIGNTGPYTCEICGKAFSTRGYLRSHMIVHGERKFMCDLCGKCFRRMTVLKIHHRSHSGYRPYKCQECNKSFFVNSNLVVHMRLHTGERPFVCDSCGKTFHTSSHLSHHKLIAHQSEKPFVCEQCGKAFKSKNYLGIHKQIHKRDRPHKCSICGFGFIRRAGLLRHLASNAHSTSRKTYNCKECNIVFGSRADFRSHKSRHVYKCDICSREFKAGAPLRKHIASTHSEERFPCKICGKSFKSARSLREHSVVHTGERRFKCDICAKTFKHRKSLAYHKKHAHPLPGFSEIMNAIDQTMSMFKPLNQQE